MKKIILIPVIIVIIIGIFGIMMVTESCPPAGWQGPRPPWCAQPETGGAFEYHELNYITDTFEPTTKLLLMIIGTMDMWGNPHVGIDMGEIPNKNVVPTMERSGSIGAEALYLTDFVTYDKDLKLEYKYSSLIPAALTMEQKEINNVVSSAKTNGMNIIILNTNMYDPDFVFQKWMGGDITESGQYKFSNGNHEETLEIMFPQWEQKIYEQAEKAQAAGIDYLVINPGDSSFEYYNDLSVLSQKYKSIIPGIRERFDGNIGILGGLEYIGSDEFNVVNDLDFVIVAWDANLGWKIKEIFSDTEETADDIESSFVEWLTLSEWNRFVGKQVFIHVTMPSYDNAMREGWIEPSQGEDRWTRDDKEQALIYEGLYRALYNNNFNVEGVIAYGYWWSDQMYPVAKDLRNDIMHSIRQKDAEHVFYKWSQIFN